MHIRITGVKSNKLQKKEKKILLNLPLYQETKGEKKKKQ